MLSDVGRAVRAVHDASVGLALPPGGWRRPAVEPVEVVCHGDVAPYNCVFVDRRLVALIDWDHALPGPRLRDLGSAAYRFAGSGRTAGCGGWCGVGLRQLRPLGLVQCTVSSRARCLVQPVCLTRWWRRQSGPKFHNS